MAITVAMGGVNGERSIQASVSVLADAHGATGLDQVQEDKDAWRWQNVLVFFFFADCVLKRGRCWIDELDR